MMDMLHRCQKTFCKALLTERMRVSVLLSDPSPCSAVPLLGLGITSVSFVVPVHLTLVFLTVPSVGKPRTAGVGTGTLCSHRHGFFHYLFYILNVKMYLISVVIIEF